MVRPREFNEGAVLDAAMKAFWRHGYAATPMSELLEVTGLSKSSLYDSFGCKHELLLVVLDRAIEDDRRALAARLAAGPSAKAAIRADFEHMLSQIASDEQERGCFVGNCANELGPHDPDVGRRVADALARSAEIYADTVRRGQAMGEIDPAHDPDAMGRYLVACQQGLHVMAKARRDLPALRATMDVMLKAIDR